MEQQTIGHKPQKAFTCHSDALCFNIRNVLRLEGWPLSSRQVGVILTTCLSQVNSLSLFLLLLLCPLLFFPQHFTNEGSSALRRSVIYHVAGLCSRFEWRGFQFRLVSRKPMRFSFKSWEGSGLGCATFRISYRSWFQFPIRVLLE